MAIPPGVSCFPPLILCMALLGCHTQTPKNPPKKAPAKKTPAAKKPPVLPKTPVLARRGAWAYPTAYKQFTRFVGELKAAEKAQKPIDSVLTLWFGATPTGCTLKKGEWSIVAVPGTDSKKTEPRPAVIIGADKPHKPRQGYSCRPNYPIDACVISLQNTGKDSWALFAAGATFPFRRTTNSDMFTWDHQWRYSLVELRQDESPCVDETAEESGYKSRIETTTLLCYRGGRFSILTDFSTESMESADSSSSRSSSHHWVSAGKGYFLVVTEKSSSSSTNSTGGQRMSEEETTTVYELEKGCASLSPLTSGELSGLRKKHPDADLPDPARLHIRRSHEPEE